VRIPQELPQGLSVEAFGLRPMAMAPTLHAAMMSTPAAPDAPRGRRSAPRAESYRAEPPRTKARSAPMTRPSPTVGGWSFSSSSSSSSSSERRFAGQVVLREGRRLTVRFTVAGPPLDWRPAAVEVIERGGRRLAASIIESTPAGELPPAGVVELVMTLAESESEGALLEVMVSGGPELVIVVL
jgi:hypothetical protein